MHKLADVYRTRSGLTDITTLVYPGARHEIFNEVMQADVRADVLAWLDKRFPRATEGLNRPAAGTASHAETGSNAETHRSR